MKIRHLLIVGVAVFATMITVVNTTKVSKAKQAVEEVSLPPSKLPDSLVEETDRAKLRDEWLASADRLATQANNSEALEFVAFIKKNAVVAEPMEHGFFTRVDEAVDKLDLEKDPWFGLMLLCRGDDRVNLDIRAAYHNVEGTGHASFDAHQRLLILKSHVPMCWLSQGILVLHEGRHAKEFLTRKYDVNNQRVWCEEERDTYDFQNSLLTAAFGEPYTERIDSLSVEFERMTREKGKEPGAYLVPTTRWYTEFNDVLPELKSPSDEKFRNAHLWVHGMFHMLERAHPNGAGEAKAQLMYWLRMAHGIPAA